MYGRLSCLACLDFFDFDKQAYRYLIKYLINILLTADEQLLEQWEEEKNTSSELSVRPNI